MKEPAHVALASVCTEAAAAERELEAFCYSVTHDLRAPLRAITGFSQILREDHGAQLDHAGRELIHDILTAARKMSTLMDGLLSLVRLSRSELHRERIDLGPIVRAATRFLAAGQPERQVQVISAESMPADADPRLARVLIEHLLGNAWKFTSRAAAPRIEIGETECEGERAFYVRDNGVGFDMAYAANLFGPFQRLHGDRELAGVGIGLAAAQRIIRRHGGRIWAESAVDAGATFFFTFEPASENPP
ncbi:MAG TPA: ATP-binding protein [Kofleriaceae bacterium]